MSDEDVKIEASWKKVLQDEFGKEYFKTLREFVILFLIASWTA